MSPGNRTTLIPALLAVHHAPWHAWRSSALVSCAWRLSWSAGARARTPRFHVADSRMGTPYRIRVRNSPQSQAILRTPRYLLGGHLLAILLLRCRSRNISPVGGTSSSLSQRPLVSKVTSTGDAVHSSYLGRWFTRSIAPNGRFSPDGDRGRGDSTVWLNSV